MKPECIICWQIRNWVSCDILYYILIDGEEVAIPFDPPITSYRLVLYWICRSSPQAQPIHNEESDPEKKVGSQ